MGPVQKVYNFSLGRIVMIFSTQTLFAQWQMQHQTPVTILGLLYVPG